VRRALTTNTAEEVIRWHPPSTERRGLTRRQGLSLGGGNLVDAFPLVDVAALHHFEVQVTGHLGDEEHAHQLT